MSFSKGYFLRDFLGDGLKANTIDNGWETAPPPVYKCKRKNKALAVLVSLSHSFICPTEIYCSGGSKSKACLLWFWSCVFWVTHQITSTKASCLSRMKKPKASAAAAAFTSLLKAGLVSAHACAISFEKPVFFSLNLNGNVRLIRSRLASIHGLLALLHSFRGCFQEIFQSCWMKTLLWNRKLASRSILILAEVCAAEKCSIIFRNLFACMISRMM